jgi:hypothetical protein
MLHLMCWYNAKHKGFDYFETLDKAPRDLIYDECKGYHKEDMVLLMTLQLLKLMASNGG